MSSADLSSLVYLLQEARITLCCAFAITVVYCYDWVITFDEEVAYVWKNRAILSRMLYFFNRYTMLLLLLLDISLTSFGTWQTDKRCAIVGNVVYALQMLSLLAVGWFPAIRIYAISRNWIISATAFVIGTMPMANKLFTTIKSSYVAVPPPFGGCGGSDDVSAGLAFRLSLASCLCLIAADVLALLVTWYKTFFIVRAAMKSKTQASLSMLLLRDGTVYFVGILVLNIVELLVQVIPTFVINEVGNFALPLMCILVNRFILDLRQVDHEPQLGIDNDQTGLAGSALVGGLSSTISEIRFARSIIGNMGEPLRHGEDSDAGTSFDAEDVPQDGEEGDSEGMNGEADRARVSASKEISEAEAEADSGVHGLAFRSSIIEISR